MLGALGVVFGDIGTSPIYAFRESIKASHDPGNPTVLLGVLSLIFWAVTLIVAVKYVLIVMRADNQGEPSSLASSLRAVRLESTSSAFLSRLTIDVFQASSP
jgi:KUP system potassium uptake protein